MNFKLFIKKYFNQVVYVIYFLVIALPLIFWSIFIDWSFGDLSSYQLFPLFGMLAFSIMWAHFAIGGIKKYLDIKSSEPSKLFEITSILVLLLLFLHPGILIFQLWKDGFGLPPGSYKNYVASSVIWAIYFGAVGWCIFMLFELRRLYNNKKWWKYVLYANDLAIMLVFIHSLKLGSTLNNTGLKYLWYFYGFTLVLIFIDKYSSIKIKNTRN